MSQELNLAIDNIAGVCPVQGNGTVNGVPFYFRARGDHWGMAIGDDPVAVSLRWKDGWYKEQPWGNGPHDAGWMPLDEAERIIRECAAEFVAENNQPLHLPISA